MAVDGDVKNSTYADKFFEAFPERSFEAYIAEQNMVGLGMGLAAKGYIPFIATFAAFLSRAHDQVRMAGYSLSNIKLCGSHVGVSIGEDGPSQMGLEDLAIFRSVPGCVVLYPSDAVSAEALVAAMAGHEGMAYLRTTRPATPILYPVGEPFPIGGAKVLGRGEGDAVTVVAAGITVHEALKAREALAREGLGVRVVDAYSVAPLDAAAISPRGRGDGRPGRRRRGPLRRPAASARLSPRRWPGRPRSGISASASCPARGSPTSSWNDTASAPRPSPEPSGSWRGDRPADGEPAGGGGQWELNGRSGRSWRASSFSPSSRFRACSANPLWPHRRCGER